LTRRPKPERKRKKNKKAKENNSAECLLLLWLLNTKFSLCYVVLALLCLLALLYLLMPYDEDDGPRAGYARKIMNYIIQWEVSKSNGGSPKVALLSVSCRSHVRVCREARYTG